LLIGCNTVIKNSTLTGNYAGYGNYGSGNERGFGGDGGSGGGIYAINSQLSIDSTDIVSNFSGRGGESGTYGIPESLGDAGHGGGIYFKECCLNIENCLFRENQTGKGADADFIVSSGGNGGNGGGIYITEPNGSCLIRNCLFEENLTGDGGTVEVHLDTGVLSGVCGGNGAGIAIYKSDFPIMIVNNSIKSNLCGNSVIPSNLPFGFSGLIIPNGGSGGGIYNSNSNTTLINSTIADNSSGSATIYTGDPNLIPIDSTRGMGGGMIGLQHAINSIIANNFLADYTLFNDLEGLCNLNYSLLSTDTLAEFSGIGNLINVDPSFINFPDSLSLAPTSHAINHGSPDTTGLALPATDLAGNPRIYGERIDMGAYEYQGEPQDHYSITPENIKMATIISGSSTIDSLSFLNYGIHPLVITSITVNAPFTLSLDKSDWSGVLENISLPTGDPCFSETIYVKFESLAPGLFTDSILFKIFDSTVVVQISGLCKESEGIYDEENIVVVYLSPNPFSDETRITFNLEIKEDVFLDVFDSKGIRVDHMMLIDQPPGINTITWKRKNLPSGLYFYRLKFGNRTALGKFVIIDSN
jgi:hypothetical protein